MSAPTCQMLYVHYERQNKESLEKRFAYRGNVPKNHRQLEVEKWHNYGDRPLQLFLDTPSGPEQPELKKFCHSPLAEVSM